VVMVGDGALGLWRALREVFPATREQRCWRLSVPRGHARSVREEVRLVA
jgi:transposase-like protein